MPISTLGPNALASSSVTRPKIGYAGAVLQVVHGSLGTSFTGTGIAGATDYWVTVTGLSATITPTSTSSRILITVQMYVGADTTASGYQQQFQILRNGTAPSSLIGSAEGGRAGVTGRINLYANAGLTYSMAVLSSTNLDSPASTSALTYSIQLKGYSGSPTVYVNRAATFQNGGSNYDGVPLSTITLMEIAG